MTIRFEMASTGSASNQSTGTRVIRATRQSHRTVKLDLRPTEEQGREAWTYLHTTSDDPETAIVKFESMIPSYGCTCKSDYAKIKEQYPFDCSSPDAFFVSGVNLHNVVNRKLGKPELSLEEARKIWNRLAPME